jgi:hypothetical protein
MLAVGLGVVAGLIFAPEAKFIGSGITLFLVGAILSSWVGVALASARPTR